MQVEVLPGSLAKNLGGNKALTEVVFKRQGAWRID